MSKIFFFLMFMLFCQVVLFGMVGVNPESYFPVPEKDVNAVPGMSTLSSRHFCLTSEGT